MERNLLRQEIIANRGAGMIDKERLKKDFDELVPKGEKSAVKLHDALAKAVMKQAAGLMDSSEPKGRRAAYLSAEFLVGRAIYNNLLCLGLNEEAEGLLKSAGASLSDFEEIEDAALGNGGLGRLAACFLDSAATLKYPVEGYGIRYKYGLFKQKFVNGSQVELADDWTKFGDPWSVKREDEAVTVRFSDLEVKAVPYDMPIFGYKNDYAVTLRLWEAHSPEGFDFDAFNNSDFIGAFKNRNAAESISQVLYPNDSTESGKILRLRQEYFFSAASIADLVRKHIAAGRKIEEFADYNAVQLNDTHPTIAIPELVRVLTSEHNICFEDALSIAQKTFNYTNHTIMAEALETWGCNVMEKMLPEIYNIILRINEEFISDMYRRNMPADRIIRMKPVSNGVIHMAKMAIYCSSHTNGVAEIHTEILKNNALNEWYDLYPERFLNQTNGITPRRWLRLCNPELSELITELLGSEKWVTELYRLEELKKFADDKTVLERFAKIKQLKKGQLADHILAHENVKLDPDSIFDIQIKRLHEYKRQLLNAFSIMYLYYGIKNKEITDFKPVSFIFGAKSAPGYFRAKGIIRYINEIAELVNSDKEISDLIKVVFVSNYNVSYAEKIVTAADISEQISTAGTEASGTGNMKFMLNGAVTLGTYDGANIEIAEEAGEDNNYIFGARVEEINNMRDSYDPRRIYAEDKKIAKVLNTLIDGTFSDGGSGAFRELFYSLLDGASWHKPDNYFLLHDFKSYVDTKLKANSDYLNNKPDFTRKCWLNMSSAGKFSSDRTIEGYCKDVWFLTRQ